MKQSTKTVYKCDFCKKNYLNKGAGERHQVACGKNPANERLCFGCIFLEKKATEVFYDTWQGEQGRTLELFYYEKVKSYLHTPQNELKKNAFDLGDDANDPMKTECEHFETVNQPNFLNR